MTACGKRFKIALHNILSWVVSSGKTPAVFISHFLVVVVQPSRTSILAFCSVRAR